MSSSRLSLMAVSTLALMAAAPVSAQTVNEDVIPEIVVTVQKREQKLLNVPAAVTGLSNSFLTDVGITDFAELALFVPGFEVQDQSPNNPGFVMRGVTSDSGTATAETRVSVFQDGVSISRSRGSYVELFDLERVEVAKGPQSTLFGRGALIGAVNVIQAKAKPVLDAKAAVSAGDYNFRMVDAMINVPLGDTFAVRLAGRTKHRDGYVENLLGGKDFNGLGTDALRLSAAWTPSDVLGFDLIVNTQKDSTPGTAFKSGTWNPTDPNTGAVLGDRTPFGGAALSPGFLGRDLGLERTVTGTTLLGRWAINDVWSLSSISAHRRFSASEVFDADGMSLNLLTAAEIAKGSQWSQELRLNYDTGGAVSWFAGVSYFKEEASTAVPLQFDERAAGLFLANVLTRPTPQSLPVLQATANAAFGPLAPYLDTTHREVSTTYGDTKSIDAYADATWRVTPKFELSAGIRYTQDDKVSGYSASVETPSVLAAASQLSPAISAQVNQLATQYFLQTGTAPSQAMIATWTAAVTKAAVAGLPPVGIFKQPTPGNGNVVSQSFSDDGVTWRLVGRYLFSDTVNGYVSVARGRQPKVLSGDSGATPLAQPKFTQADAETVDSLELGLKTRLMGGRLSWDTAVYGYKYENFQTQVSTSTGGLVTVSAGEADAYGLETQAYYRVIPGADIFATYAYNHSRFGNGIYKGNRFRLSPDHSVSLGGRFKFSTEALRFWVTPTYTWQSDVFFENDNDLPQFQTAVPNLRPVGDTVQDEKQKAYGLLNLRLGFAPKKAPWSVEVFADNLTDEAYIKDAGNTGDNLGVATFIAGEPRMVGVTVRVNY
ncbi:TonB-dependent receptor [Asticcacaulis sp. YBE204]|uniref:TonB-dependent receptor n=1 Tax=Asticcacaulis sp. YBE204 TaxID=1282363 RepID=UPI0003C408B9|nr:TonB-dependent receptor [Asticcacaulis sp. YBE204]ESQ77835.1 TonB-denpendent receptor [Asticcacaulis sp. YBE204]